MWPSVQVMNAISTSRELHLVHPGNRIHAAQSLGSEIFLPIEAFHSVVDDCQNGWFPDENTVVVAVDHRRDEENECRELQECWQKDIPPAYFHVRLFCISASAYFLLCCLESLVCQCCSDVFQPFLEATC